MQLIYPAVIKQTENGHWHCRVPDLAGCEACGETIDEAMEELHARAQDWIAVELEEEGVFLPPVSDPDDLEREDGEMVRKICITLKLTEGWEE